MTSNQLPPLSDEQMDSIFADWLDAACLIHQEGSDTIEPAPQTHLHKNDVVQLMRVVESAALAALAQQAQEPFAYMADDVAAGVLEGSVLLSAAIRGAPGGTFNFPIYTRPQQAQEPVYWEWRHLGSNQHAADFGQWSQWQKVEARSLLFTVEDELRSFRRYIADGYKYELRALYTTPPAPQVPAPVDELIEALEDLMDWQVKNVKSWHNRAYDRAHFVIEKHRAALQSPAPQTEGQP